MNNTLEQLIKLQEIDQRLLEIKEHMGDLPKMVESQESEIELLRVENLKSHDKLLEIETNIKQHSSEIEDFTAKLEKYKEQLFLVKSNKEYDAINLEIDHMKSTILDSETVQLKFEEEKLELEEKVKINSAKIESINTSLTINKSELEEAMADTIHEKKDLESNRNMLNKNIEPNYLEKYEELREARNIGMVSIIGSACGGCYSQMPPQTVIEIKESKEIIDCPNCSVLQFWDGAEE